MKVHQHKSRGCSTNMKVIPTDASTVMLIRACPDASIKDIEVLMVRRNRKSSFVQVIMSFRAAFWKAKILAPDGTLYPGN